jgi:hypothetical protein
MTAFTLFQFASRKPGLGAMARYMFGTKSMPRVSLMSS